MDKPISLIIEETKKSIIDTLNNSQLHPYVMDMIVKDLYEEVHRAMLIQSENEKTEYNKYVNEHSDNIEKSE